MCIYFSPQLLSEYNVDQVSSAILDRDLSAKRTFGLRRRWGRQVEGIYLPALEWFSKESKDGRERIMSYVQCACAESYAANVTDRRRRNMSREVLPRDKRRTAALGMVMALKEMVKGVLYSLETWEIGAIFTCTEQQVRPGPGQAAGLERALCRRGVRGIMQTASVVFQ